jgi:hypothetical protein
MVLRILLQLGILWSLLFTLRVGQENSLYNITLLYPPQEILKAQIRNKNFKPLSSGITMPSKV